MEWIYESVIFSEPVSLSKTTVLHHFKNTAVYFLLLILCACTPATEQKMASSETSNRLINESSPYLQQHAHNPVDWFPWGEEAFEKARAENKLVLVSIGYSACHWCHVMERESFENDSVAAVMNEHFVCIKVDREERPDVDQIYMNAVQLMTGSGGWPLNCFTLPDGRPVYGGTYFPTDQWVKILHTLHESWQQEPEKFDAYAERLTQGVRESELVQINNSEDAFSADSLSELVAKWKPEFDRHFGGSDRAPKFPLPNNFEFLMHYAHITGDEAVENHVLLTLEQMATGGIYDQIGGGFARYSVDSFWKVPHFEKMLYDNAQLLSLYSKAFQYNADPIYQRIVEQTCEWIDREMTTENGAFYSALDADSEGEEGKFYVWTSEELKSLFPEDFDFVMDLYNHQDVGLWEEEKIILMRRISDAELMEQYQLTDDALLRKTEEVNRRLMSERDNRVRPGLDDKTLTSWNALTISGLCHAHHAFGNQKYLEMAIRNGQFILEEQRREDGGLYHSYKKGRSSINGYLEDYAFTIEAFIDLYETTFDESWLSNAEALTEYTIAHFADDTTGMFYFTSDLDPPLIARKTEINDNVIPASNSAMAKALFKLGHVLGKKEYLDRSRQMLRNVAPMMTGYGSGFSNWAQLMMYHVHPFYEVVITGENAGDFGLKMRAAYGPDRMVLGATQNNTIPLFENRFFDGQTTIFVCVNQACQMPVNTVDDALKQMKR